jgi:hypothetical protein
MAPHQDEPLLLTPEEVACVLRKKSRRAIYSMVERGRSGRYADRPQCAVSQA